MFRLLLFTLFFCSSLVAQRNLLEEAEKHLYSQKDSAYYYLDKLIKNTVDKQDWVKAIEALTYKNVASNYHNDLLTLQASLQQEDEIFNTYIKAIDTLDQGKLYTFYYWYDKGSFYYTLHNYKKSFLYFFKLLNAIEKLPDAVIATNYSEFLTVTNNYLATMYKNEFKYELAEEFYKENLRLHKKYKHTQAQMYPTKDLIAALKSSDKQYKTSNRYAKESIQFYLNNKPNDNIRSLVSASILLANNYIALQQLDSAVYYLNKTKPFSKEIMSLNLGLLKTEARVFTKKNEYTKALEIYDNLLKTSAINALGGDRLAILYKEMGDVYLLKKQAKEALHYYQLGFNLYATNKQNQLESANSKTNILQLINGICNAHQFLKTKNDYQTILKMGFATAKKLDTLKTTFTDDTDKQVLVENVLPIFEKAIEANYQLFSTTKNNAYIDTAFVFFERSKGTILLDALYKNNAEKYAGVPDVLLEKEKLLKRSIALLSKKVQQDSKKENELFRLKRDYEKLIQELEQNHSTYYNLKYGKQFISLKEVQQQLTGTEMVLSYFYGQQAVYLIAITEVDKTVHKIGSNNLDKEQLVQFQKMIANPKSDIDQIARLSFKIYTKFLKPALKNNESIKNLIIMPDGLLRNIPFESLNTSKTQLDYLIYSKSISYINSTTLWFQLQTTNKTNQTLLAFAPSFDSNFEEIQQFSKLPSNYSEIEKIHNYYKGKIFLDSSATLQNFKDNLAAYSIIHLATHAQTNDAFPEYSFLAFSPNKTKEYLMYINDLYATNINADLVTLSACKTGLGDLKKGEGMLSLSRAFYYAGAKSLLYTLWNINDNSSAELMDVFYKKLSEGYTKNDALRNAKLLFLKKNKENKLAHPYYWSGFIISGNTQPLSNNTHLMWYLLGFVGLLITIVAVKKLS